MHQMMMKSGQKDRPVSVGKVQLDNIGSKMQFYHFWVSSCNKWGFIKAEKTSVCNCIIVKEVSKLKFSHNKEPSCQGKQDHLPIAISRKSPITPNQNYWLRETKF
jgi:hypothetical protein